jgi:hypothetical protein
VEEILQQAESDDNAKSENHTRLNLGHAAFNVDMEEGEVDEHAGEIPNERASDAVFENGSVHNNPNLPCAHQIFAFS